MDSPPEMINVGASLPAPTAAPIDRTTVAVIMTRRDGFIDQISL
jgi:hypothetical protein